MLKRLQTSFIDTMTYGLLSTLSTPTTVATARNSMHATVPCLGAVDLSCCTSAGGYLCLPVVLRLCSALIGFYEQCYNTLRFVSLSAVSHQHHSLAVITGEPNDKTHAYRRHP